MIGGDIISLKEKRIIERTIKEAISDVLGINIDIIDKTSTLYDDLGIDDLDLIEIIMAIEREFGFNVNDGVIDSFRTVENIYTYIYSKREFIKKEK